MSNSFFIDNWKNEIKETKTKRNQGILYYIIIHSISYSILFYSSDGKQNHLQILAIVINEIVWAEMLSTHLDILSKEDYVAKWVATYEDYIHSFGDALMPLITKRFAYEYQQIAMQHKIFNSLVSVFVFNFLFSNLVANHDSYTDGLILLVVSGMFLWMPFAYIKEKLFFSRNLKILKD